MDYLVALHTQKVSIIIDIAQRFTTQTKTVGDVNFCLCRLHFTSIAREKEGLKKEKRGGTRLDASLDK